MLANANDPFATRTVTTATFPDEEVAGDKDKQIAYLNWLIDYCNNELSLGRASRSSLERDLAKRDETIAELKQQTIDEGQIAIDSEWFELFRGVMQDVVSYWRKSHPDLDRRVHELVKAWEAGDAKYVPFDKRLAERDATIAELRTEKETAESAMDNLARKLSETERGVDLAATALSRANEKNAELHFANGSLRSQLARAAAIAVAARDAVLSQLPRRGDAVEISGRKFDALVRALNAPGSAVPADAPTNSPMGETETKRIDAACRERGESKSLCCPACKSYFLSCGGPTVTCGDCGHVANRADVTTRGETERRREAAQADSISRRCDADDLATTANNMDVAQRHGRVCRLHRAGKAVEEAYNGGGGMIKAMGDLIDTLAEFGPDDLGQIPPETKADQLLSELRGMVQRQAKELDALRSLGNAACKTGHDVILRFTGVDLPTVTEQRLAIHKAALEAWRAATKEGT